MQITNPAEALAREITRNPMFNAHPADDFRRERNYRLFFGVPVSALRVADQEPEPRFSGSVIDLLICRDCEAVLAFVFDPECRDLEELFSSYLSRLPRVFLQSREMTESAIRELCGELDFQLRCDRSAPAYTGCALNRVLLSRMVRECTGAAGQEGTALLHRNGLLTPDGWVTPYGAYSGIFRQMYRDGTCRYFATRRATARLEEALCWHDDTADGALAQRIGRIGQGLPGDRAAAEHAVSALQRLLEMPLEALFHAHPMTANHLSAQLCRAQSLSRNAPVTAYGDKADIRTYGDALGAVANLWMYTAQSGEEQDEARSTCCALLLDLAEPFHTPQGFQFAEDAPACLGQNLESQLRQIQPGGEGFPIPALPLSHYYYAAACLLGSTYPLWLYRTSVEPCLRRYARTAWTLPRALRLAQELYYDEDDAVSADFLPLIYQLLVEPVRTIF